MSVTNNLNQYKIYNLSQYKEYGDEFTIIEKIKKFRETVQDVLQPHHDARFLLRWLKARDFDICRAEKMLRESLKFRKVFDVDTILSGKYQYPEVYAINQVMFQVGYDKDNSIIRYCAVGCCDFKALARCMTLKERKKIFIHIFESDQKAQEDRRKALNRPEVTDYVSYILDCKDFSIKTFYSKSMVSFIIQLIAMYQDNYPETLKVVYFINVPSWYKWLYNMFSPFIHPNTLKKYKIYCTDEWRDVLKENIDLKILPAFLGGEFMDPEGDIYCSNLIRWKSNIPEKYYLHNRSAHESLKLLNAKQVTVAKRTAIEIPVFVGVPGSVLRWIFKTKDYTIKFGLLYKGKMEERVEILPMDEIECQDIPEDNEIICTKSGSYILCFDNSYSWLNTKQISYKVDIYPPEVIDDNQCIS